jgi:hypothetical protein
VLGFHGRLLLGSDVLIQPAAVRVIIDEDIQVVVQAVLDHFLDSVQPDVADLAGLLVAILPPTSSSRTRGSMLSIFSMGPDPSDRRVREDDVGLCFCDLNPLAFCAAEYPYLRINEIV